MSKEQLKIADFNILMDTFKSLSKMSEGVKITVNEFGFTVNAKNDYSKCELTSNSMTSNKELSFCIGELNMLIKIFNTLKNIYKDNVEESIKLYFDSPFIKIESKKFKTKISTTEESRITQFVGTKVHTELTPQIDFTTNSQIIRSINSHSFISIDSSASRVYLSTESEMENNVIFATIGNENNDLENSLTLELGLVTNGSLNERKVILDFNRLNMLNMVQSDEINVYLANERPVLVSNIKRNGKNGTFFNVNLFIFMMVK